MTSNLGAAKIQTNSSLGFRQQGDTADSRAAASYDLIKEKVQAELQQNFRPEFLNRIDATVVFPKPDGRGDRGDRRPDAQAGP